MYFFISKISCFALGTLSSEKHAYVDTWDLGGGTVALP